MKFLEYSSYDLSNNEAEFKNNINKIIYLDNIDSISVLPYFTKIAKDHVPSHIKISTVIDYPFGISDTASRMLSVEKAIKSGTSAIELLCPMPILINRKYNKFRQEIDDIKNICYHNKIELKYVLEYKILSSVLMQKICQILISKQIYNIYTSAGYLLNNIVDNILVSMLLLEKNTDLNIILNGQAWHEKQINMILENPKIYGYKTNNIYTLEKISKKI